MNAHCYFYDSTVTVSPPPQPPPSPPPTATNFTTAFITCTTDRYATCTTPSGSPWPPISTRFQPAPPSSSAPGFLLPLMTHSLQSSQANPRWLQQPSEPPTGDATACVGIEAPAFFLSERETQQCLSLTGTHSHFPRGKGLQASLGSSPFPNPSWSMAAAG